MLMHLKSNDRLKQKKLAAKGCQDRRKSDFSEVFQSILLSKSEVYVKTVVNAFETCGKYNRATLDAARTTL